MLDGRPVTGSRTTTVGSVHFFVSCDANVTPDELTGLHDDSAPLTPMWRPCDSDRVHFEGAGTDQIEGAMTFGAKGYALAPGEGEGLWFFNGLFTVKAGGPDTREAFTLIEAELPAGEGPPPHIHHKEDEGFYVLQGEVSITCGEQTWTALPGSFAMLPRGIPHSFKVSPEGNARMLQITSPAQFERFAAEMGEPANTKTMPKAAEVDIPKLLGIVPKYGIEMLPPPP